MNNDPDYIISHLNDCGCCDGVTVETPIEIANRPSLQAIAYRIGEHPDFKASMLARLSSTDFSSLKDLRTRNDNDFSIALLDAWAMVADVLTFYDQTFANESYLRTATERLSIFELARLVGYKPRPGLAASTLLAFTMDELPGSPEKITLSVGTKVQSTPKQDEQAQLFESVEEIEARPAWNSIRPRLTKPQIPLSSTKELLFDGTDTGLKPGDGVLFTPTGASDKNIFAIISLVRLDQENNRTCVRLAKLDTTSIHGSAKTSNKNDEGLPLPAGNYLGQTIEAQDLEAEAKTHDFDIQEIFDALSVNIPSSHSAVVFRQVASIFGHNAPAWESLPDSLKGDIPIFDTNDSGTRVFIKEFKPGPFKNDKDIWPGPTSGTLDILKYGGCPHGTSSKNNEDSNAKGLEITPKEIELKPFDFPQNGDSSSDPPDIEFVNMFLSSPLTLLFLDNSYKGITTDSKLVLKDGNIWGLYEIKDATELTKSCFTVTSKVTRFELDSAEKFEDFSIRGTSVYFQSESLPLARVPIEDTVPVGISQTLKLNGFIDGLYQGQRVVLSGIEINGAQNPISEILTLDKVEHELVLGGGTTITFSPALKHVYKRETVTINANIAAATHGETVQEVLGSGDAIQTYQTFTLKQPPLTHVSAKTPSGAESTLQVRVNDVLWHETDRLFGKGPEDRVFVTRTNDKGETIIKFGNGITGARLPTGHDNVRAVYRKGIGAQGLVDAGQINMLMSRPLGLKEAVNPFAPTGADDPESHDDAQHNAPLTVLTLDRAVSLRDYEDFTRAFTGIAKALAVSALSGQVKTIFITVAGPDGALIPDDSPVYKNLLSTLAGAGDPSTRFRVMSYRPVTFRIGAKVKVDPDFITEKVLTEVDAALRTTFSFQMREFGQPVALSEVIAIIQAITGVVAVDVDFLYRGKIQKPEPRIPAQAPVIKNNGQLQAAELLTLHPGPLDHLEVMA